MKNQITLTLKLAATAAFAAFALTGCMTDNPSDPTTDGGNAVVKQEADNMGTVLNESASSSGSVLAKVSASAADTVTTTFAIDSITGEKVLIRLHPDSGCGCYIREAWDTTSVGFERQRLDSIWLDSSGVRLTGLPFRPVDADSITHKRYITRIGTEGKEIDIVISSTLTKATDDDSTVFNWKGTITGTFNGVTFENTSIDIVRDVIGSGPTREIGPASSGYIQMQRGAYVIKMSFDRDGSGSTATCVVTKNGVQVRTTTIDINGNES